MISIDWRSFSKKRSPLKGGFPTGMVLFTGRQGGGKSLSQSRYVYQLQEKFGAKVYSATDYKRADVKIDESEISDHILTKRDVRPTVFLLDEIQVLLDTTAGKLKPEVLKAIAQQRKRNTSIIGTLQVFLDLDIRYRRQIKYVVNCSFVGPIQIERWLEGETLTFDQESNKYSGRIAHIRIWKRHNEIFNLYDTHEVVGERKG